MDQGNNNLTNNQNVLSEGEQLVDDTTSRKRKNRHRHMSEQIQRMEMFFKDCSDPSENQRKELGIDQSNKKIKLIDPTSRFNLFGGEKKKTKTAARVRYICDVDNAHDINSLNYFINTPNTTPDQFPIKQLQEVFNMDQGNNNLTNNQNVLSEGEQLVDDATSRKRKNRHRHTSEQIQRMEMFFKDCSHPSENQRKELGIELGLDPLQIKFWFQNKRTQMKIN
ncbi:hypothetical protein M9H77_19984 [Catharanthus roseus]|uniref:Uncharacterized protein n=1 Tax=Catharanthus roseus TaxID=4058 RepID=A0ACC0AMD2_CATRO|nr:hypothetical protein M9H77_19984 [Catharanthus roseus]